MYLESRPRARGRVLSVAVSLVLHSAVVAALLWLPATGPASSGPTLYEQEIAPHKDKIVWYRLQKLPQITPDAASKSIRHPGALRPNKDTIVSTLPDAPESRQLTWTERPRPEPRPFQSPNMISIRKQPEIAVNAPELAPEAAGQPKPAELQIPKLAPKPFVAPGSERKPAREVKTLALADAPTITDIPRPSGADSALAVLNAASGVRTPKPFTAPPGKKPGAQLGNGTVPDLGTAPGLETAGSGEVNALALNTMNSALASGLPPLSNSRVSAGPHAGSDAAGSGSGLRIPGVTVQPGGRSPLPDVSGAKLPPANLPPYIATSVAPLQQTYSAPLAPSARFIPPAIEARFHNRVVYTVILPMRKVPGYSADWVVWFAEHAPENGMGSQVQIRAPLPIRKFSRSDRSGLPARVQLAATIDHTGRVTAASVLGSATPGSDAALEDLKCWEFLPALRNRSPVDVDVVVEITFSGPTSTPAALKGIRSAVSTAGN